MKTNIVLSILLSSLSAFSQSIDQNHTGTNTNFLSCEQISLNAQSFSAGLSGLLNEIKIDADAQICPFNVSLDTIAFAVNIFDGNGTTGTLLATQNVVMNLPYPRNLFPVSFDNPALVTAGNQYTIELRVNFGQICDPPSIAINFIWYTSASNDYPGGQPYSSLVSSVTNDFYFQTFVTTSSGIKLNSTAANPIVSLFPNPAFNDIHLNLEVEQDYFYKIATITGETIETGTLKNNKNTIDISNFSNGIYSILIYNDRYVLSNYFIKN